MTVAVLDACVLYPAALRDVLLWLAAESVYHPRWTDAIHEEWMRAVLADRPDLTREQLERTRSLMNQVDPESLVEGYEEFVSSLALPDQDDRHVLAAAIAAKASVIVTFNLSDFPKAVLAPFRVRALHPDAFLISLLDQEPVACLEGLRKHWASLRRPPKTRDEYLEALRHTGLCALARRLEEHDALSC
jgi:predicted nucleic acid-binding protein